VPVRRPEEGQLLVRLFNSNIEVHGSVKNDSSASAICLGQYGWLGDIVAIRV
jgi:hypothetical protein